MFKIGDKVVCINDKGVNKTDNPFSFNKKLEVIKYNNYTIKSIDTTYYTCRVGLYELIEFYYADRFILLKDYRKQKLIKLCSSQEIK